MRRALLMVFAFLLATLLPACSMLSGFGGTLKKAGKGVGSTVADVDLSGQSGQIAGGVGALWMAKQLGYLKPEFIAGGLLAYGIYDPFAPTWNVRVIELDGEHRRIELAMKRLATGGEGEARQVFTRTVRQLMEKGGYADFDELRYEESIDSTRPFARRTAQGEIRLVKSRIFPGI